MLEKHKLAVILFADIAGYTALMEQDEQAALNILHRFKGVIESTTPDYDGQIVQFFGDGALLAFYSSSRAIDCALAMQGAFRKAPKVPVRIGMHMGEVLFKNGNAFGSGVNIASRVESLAIPGAVLISKVIGNQVKNKENYKLTSLGRFEFKNVEEPMEVFALANPGLIVPKRSQMKGKLKKPASRSLPIKTILPIVLSAIIGLLIWLNFNNQKQTGQLLPEDIREEKVAVAVFSNFTNDPDLDAFGHMASDWITTGLRTLKVKTTSPEMMRQYKDRVGILPGNPDKEVSLWELTDAAYVVTGAYYQKGDSLQINSRLESTLSGDNIYDFPTIWGLIDQKEKLITEIREQLKGYWALKAAAKIATISPPKYEAYQQFLKCGLFEPDCLSKVLKIDSTFIMARIRLAFVATPYENDSLYRVMSTYLKTHWDQCTEFEKNFFTFTENRVSGNRKAAQAAMEKNLQMDPKNLDIVHFVGYIHILLNQPAQAVECFKPFFDEYEVFGNQIRPQSINAYFYSLNRLGRQQEVIDLYNKHPELSRSYSGNNEVIKAHLLNQDLSGIRQYLEVIASSPSRSLLSAHMFNAIYPTDSTNIFAAAVREHLDAFEDPKPGWNYFVWSNVHMYNWDSKAFAYYQLKEWDKAEQILSGLENTDWKAQAGASIPKTLLPHLNWHMETWRVGLLGATYARQGKRDLAYAQIEKLEASRATNPPTLNRFHKGTVSNWQARIHAALGDKEQAVRRLAQSMEEGRRIDFSNFVYDWDLASLKGYGPYEELVRPRLAPLKD